MDALDAIAEAQALRRCFHDIEDAAMEGSMALEHAVNKDHLREKVQSIVNATSRLQELLR